MASARSPECTVLVVEDEPLLRIQAVDTLEEAGFLTVEAPNADEAVRILTRRTDIRIVFSDIDMPGSMDGLKLASVIRGRWPPIDLILTSGYKIPPARDIPDRGLFFAKPYDDRKLIDAVRAFANA